MADKYLDLAGLNYLWGKITTLVSGKQDALVSGTNIKTVNSASLLGSGNIDVAQFGQSEDNGLYYPKTIVPEKVDRNSLLITEGSGITLGAKSLAVSTGTNITLSVEAAAGATQYQVANTYVNRIICSELVDGAIAVDEASADFTVPVVSVTINGQDFTPDSSADNASIPIIITTSTSVNPDSAITSIRAYPTELGFSNLYIGQGVGGNGGASIVIGQKLNNYSGNANALMGQEIYNAGGGNAVFGRRHINRKNRVFLAGEGHDTTSGADTVAAVGKWANITSTSAFVVGGGSNQTSRKNLFEVATNGSAVASGNIISENSSEANLIARCTSNTGIGLYENSSGVRGIFDYTKSNYLMYATTGDTWLYLNRGDIYTSGIYCGTKMLRTDGTLRVGTGTAPYTDIASDGIGIKVASNDYGTISVNQNGTNAIYITVEGSSHTVALGSTGANGTAYPILRRANNAHDITAYGSWGFENSQWICFNDSNGNRQRMMVMNTSNEFFVGYAGYTNKIGATYYDGNAISIRANTTVTSNKTITISSDLRLKTDIAPLDEKTNELLLNLNPFTYKWKSDKQEYEDVSEDVNIGFGAQEVEETMREIGLNPDLYHLVQKPKKKNEYYSLSYTEFVPMLVHLAQTQHKQINELKQEVSELKELIKNHIQSDK